MGFNYNFIVRSQCSCGGIIWKGLLSRSIAKIILQILCGAPPFRLSENLHFSSILGTKNARLFRHFCPLIVTWPWKLNKIRYFVVIFCLYAPTSAINSSNENIFSALDRLYPVAMSAKSHPLSAFLLTKSRLLPLPVLLFQTDAPIYTSAGSSFPCPDAV